VLDLGDHYLPDFVEPGTPRGKRWPLDLVICLGCGLLQLGESTPRSELYHERYGFKSGVNEAIRADLANVAMDALGRAKMLAEPKAWLDIASNDGTLLSNVPANIYRVGIDPLAQFAAEAKTHADAILSDYFAAGYFTAGAFDVITSVSMFYDLDDPGQFVDEVRSVLATRGVWVIQQNYALDMITQNAVDNVCHEHVTYWAVAPLKRLMEAHGLEINHVSYSDVNGGCVRTIVSHRGARRVDGSVHNALAQEALAQLSQGVTWELWGDEVMEELGNTGSALAQLKAEGQTVGVYGASTRGGTILQAIDSESRELAAYAVERQPAKVGKIMAAAGLPIISEEEMRADPPAALLVSPWFFRDVFVKREAPYLAGGGRMLFPLPRFEEVTGEAVGL
jgi:SAM-dependent methyltransferase